MTLFQTLSAGTMLQHCTRTKSLNPPHRSSSSQSSHCSRACGALRAALEALRPPNTYVRTPQRPRDKAEGSRAYSDQTSGVGRAVASRQHTSNSKSKAKTQKVWPTRRNVSIKQAQRLRSTTDKGLGLTEGLCDVALQYGSCSCDLLRARKARVLSNASQRTASARVPGSLRWCPKTPMWLPRRVDQQTANACQE
jgi:hypothetical protein